jgi:hypothetical protein
MRCIKATMMVATVAAVTVLLLATTATAQAATVQTPTAQATIVRTPEGLNCSTGYQPRYHFNGPQLVATYPAYAVCTNPTDRTIQFRVNVVCGLAPDQTGDWVTLQPHTDVPQSSNAECPDYSTGVGGVTVEDELVS